MGNTNSELFEEMDISQAAIKVMIPTILGSLVMVLYSLADTYFVGLLNNEIQSAAVSLTSPLLISFKIVNNLFGIGASSLMSRGLGKKDYQIVKTSASFGIYGSIILASVLSVLCFVFLKPLLLLLGASLDTFYATSQYVLWNVIFGAVPSILNVVLAYLVRAEGQVTHASVGTMLGCMINIFLDPIFIMAWGFKMGAAGAALATLISNCISCLYFIILLIMKKDKTSIRLHPKYLLSLNKKLFMKFVMLEYQHLFKTF